MHFQCFGDKSFVKKTGILIPLLPLILLKVADKDFCESVEIFGVGSVVRVLLDESSWNSPHYWKICHGAHLQISLDLQGGQGHLYKAQMPLLQSISSSGLIPGRDAATMFSWPKFPQKREPSPRPRNERLCHLSHLNSITWVTLVNAGLKSTPLPQASRAGFGASPNGHPSPWSCNCHQCPGPASWQPFKASVPALTMTSPCPPSSHTASSAFSKHPKRRGRNDLPLRVLC